MAGPAKADTALWKKIEQAFAQNLVQYVQAVQSVAPEVQAEARECAGGVAAFTGVGSPLTTIKGAGPDIGDDDLDSAESFFHRRGVEQTIFELAPWVSGHSLQRLLRRGYTVVGTEDVVVHPPPFGAPIPLHRVVEVDPAVWPDMQLYANGAPDTTEWRTLTRAAGWVRDAIRFGILDNSGAWIACAEVFPVGNIALFANDATLQSARGCGAQTATIHHRLREITADGFALVAAEVAPGSTSERNYLRCGFYVCYARSHYVRRVIR
jgi:hypothetical protein